MPSAALTLIPVHPALRVEVRGVDLWAPFDDATFGAILEAFEARSVLVFRDQVFLVGPA